MSAERAFRLTDSTLRDGSHAVRHQFTTDQVRTVVGALDRAGVPVIEVTHGDGLGGSSFNYGFSHTSEMELLRVAVDTATSARIAVLFVPGIGVKDDLRQAADIGAKVARIATHCTEADIAEQHIALAKESGMEAVGFLMMSHMISPEDLVEQAKKMESYGADCVYVVDSAGAMTMDGFKARVAAVKSAVDVQVGVHAHNNLSLAVANSLAAFGEGADQIDACTTGLGAGAGNCPTEVLVATCAKSGIETGVDTFAMMDAAQDAVRPIQPEMGVIDRDGLMLGYAGVYGSFLLHAKRASQRYGVDTRDILLELGRRGMVGGQEDMIIDVALELKREGARVR
ncbi:4-hydroxy-2-oxovalerate aldolase [Nocardioides agariphilus]|jgi:4-hydroxy 2-oxovalerate aldolase|uniref:4-hydroxy-2-oxovalerate aldolase n=1 Tax=Nocardioides agariphilus TaxID=433664 RepID=A0A930VNG5_9ACTN|nr:4-hydroxy-2-oxovalerate aldolase [Nocardioides agariphilus]MBF4767782.1 4-hydroxy-2-oxovalerate aldolase [Nocardioides agariphilus]